MGRIKGNEEVESSGNIIVAAATSSETEQQRRGPSVGAVEAVASYPPKAETEEQLPSVTKVEPVISSTSYPPNMNNIQASPYAEGSGGRSWTTGLFDCHLDQTNAIMTAVLPCLTFGQIAEVLDNGETTCLLGTFMYVAMLPAFCSFWIIGSNYRRKLRTRFGLAEAPYQDFVSHLVFPFCSLCQEFRELQKMGLDPALGWNGILAQQQRAMQNANQQIYNQPPPVQQMSKSV